jgi:hypothetical protein
VFTARYALSPYIKQIRFVFKGLMQGDFSRQIFEESSNIKYHENPPRGSRVDPCWRTDTQTDGRTDKQTYMTKLIVAFRTFANAPKNGSTINEVLIDNNCYRSKCVYIRKDQWINVGPKHEYQPVPATESGHAGRFYPCTPTHPPTHTHTHTQYTLCRIHFWQEKFVITKLGVETSFQDAICDSLYVTWLVELHFRAQQDYEHNCGTASDTCL